MNKSGKRNRFDNVVIGSRKSQLALRQTEIVKDLLTRQNPHVTVKVVTMDTMGDIVVDTALHKIGEKSLFTKELEAALDSGYVDVVVHSLKDLSTELSPKFVIGAVLNRESPEDVVILSDRNQQQDISFENLPVGAVIGTSSVRRVAQLKHQYPHFQLKSIRGNLNTRFLKLDYPEEAKKLGKGDGTVYDAIVLAKAGVVRLNFQRRISKVLNDGNSLYAVGQGALCCECRANDVKTLELLMPLHEEHVALSCIGERALMHRLNGGCSAPIGVRSRLLGSTKLLLRAAVFSEDGSLAVEASTEVDLPLSAAEAHIFNQSNRKRRKAHIGTICQELSESWEANDVVLGVKIHNICNIGLTRMHCARTCGELLASKLLRNGADAILLKLSKKLHETKT